MMNDAKAVLFQSGLRGLISNWLYVTLTCYKRRGSACKGRVMVVSLPLVRPLRPFSNYHLPLQVLKFAASLFAALVTLKNETEIYFPFISEPLTTFY